ncbi:MAG TPA: hypothetical protein VIM14_14075 [Polyangia bacterium]
MGDKSDPEQIRELFGLSKAGGTPCLPWPSRWVARSCPG